MRDTRWSHRLAFGLMLATVLGAAQLPADPTPPPAGRGGGAGPAGPAPLPGKAPAGPQDDPRLSAVALDDAALKLKAEFAAAAGDPKVRLREKSTYFIDHPAKLSPKALGASLEKSQSNDPRLSAYIKWQLLSAVPPGALDKDLQARIAEAYRRSPLPVTRFGSTDADRRKLEKVLASTKQADAVRLTDLLDDAVKGGEEANGVIFAYRDELYARLPAGYDRFAGGLRDAFERLNLGWPPKDLMKRVVDEATVWANSGAGEPRQYAALAQLVYRLRSERSPKYYVGVGASRTTKQPYWVSRTDAVYEAKKLAELQKLLEDKAGIRRPSIGAAK